MALDADHRYILEEEEEYHIPDPQPLTDANYTCCIEGIDNMVSSQSLVYVAYLTGVRMWGRRMQILFRFQKKD